MKITVAAFLFFLLVFFSFSNLGLAAEIKVEASSCEGSQNTPDKAADGDMSTRWGSEFSDPQWLKIDMGEQKELIGLTLRWEAAYGKSYDILLSSNGEKWEKVYSTTKGNGLADDIYFSKRTARFIKILLKERGTGWGYSLYEVSLKGADEEMIFTASSCLSRCVADKVMDGQIETGWHSERKEDSWLQIEMKKAGQLGAISIDWGKDYAVSYQVLSSKDGKNWQVICEETKGDGRSDKIFANIPTVKFIRIVANKSSNNNGYEIKELGLEKWENAAMTNALDRRRGLVCLERSKWKTFTGCDGSFAPEPWPYQVSFWLWDSAKGKLYTPQTMDTNWQLADGRLPINIIKWSADDIEVTTTIFAHNILPGDAQVTFARTSLKNSSAEDKNVSLYTVLRENPVSPRKGEKELREIKYDGGNWVSINGKNGLYLSAAADKPNCSTDSKKADIQNWADVKLLKQGDCVSSPGGKAKATLVHHIELKAGEEKSLDLFSPSAREGEDFPPDLIAALDFESNLEAVKKYWQNRVPLELNVPDKNYSDVFYSSIYYLLLLMDGDLLCPGPSAYNHFFLHDAADMAEALDKVGLKDVVRAAVEDFNYTDSQYLDELGGNIYALFSHYKLNEDVDWLEKFYPRMLEKSKILKRLRAEQLKPEFKGTVAYGLLPKSVSQDNFTIPAYLYVDNWWSLIGLKAAMESAAILNKPDDLRWLTNEYNDLLKCLLVSMEMVKKREGTDFYPGFADDWPAKYRKVDQLYRILGETQMAWAHRPALFPGEAMGIEIPLDGMKKSYQSYWEKAGAFSGYDGGWFVEYENLFWGYNIKLARPLISLGMEDVALKNLKWSLQHQSCPGAWMEAIPSKVDEKGLKAVDDNGGIVGDVPHGWVAAHYVLLLRDMLLREKDEKIILLSCVPPDWLEDGKCIEIKNAPTFFGLVSYSLQSHLKDGYLKLNLTAEKDFAGGFILNLPVEKDICSVKIDGKSWKQFGEKTVEIPALSKEIIVYY